MAVLFRVAILANAFLLFLVQPMFAKMALPLLGGSPAVWTTCMLFFQGALLVGYLYTHFSIRLLGVRVQAVAHAVLILVPLMVLPVGVPADTTAPATAVPAEWLVALMVGTVGLPFVMLSTTAPLLQRWFSLSAHTSGRDPYLLYAASNAGSLGGLLLYPAGIEPLMSLRTQQLWWAGGYAVTAAMIVACAVLTFVSVPLDAGKFFERHDSAPAIARRLRWILLAAVPSGLMLAVTSHISTDIAAVPLLWVIPLALYLSTFIIVFSSRSERVVRRSRRILPFVLLPVVLLTVGQVSAALWVVIPLHLATFWLLALLCHAELARTRPSTAHLTEYYVWLAVGGMLGGFFNTFVAPGLFERVIEYPLLMAAACLLSADPATFWEIPKSRRLLIPPLAAGLAVGILLIAATTNTLDGRVLLAMLGAGAVLCFSVSRHAAAFGLAVALPLVLAAVLPDRAWGRVLYAERTFFGVYRVTAAEDGPFVTLYHGTTVHGGQRTSDKDRAPEPLTYYSRTSPIGEVLARGESRQPRSVGVVGLGVGSLAAYVQPGQRWTFYEIDPAVERVARDDRFFTFLANCGDVCRVIIGDGRLAIRDAPNKHDVIVLDAFSSDAIPVHLLTREALRIYLDRLETDGRLVIHISNRHFELAPVVAALAADAGLTALLRSDMLDGNSRLEHTSSIWAILARRSDLLSDLASKPGWVRLTRGADQLWTDDYSNVLRVLNWR